jgi:hypothetical protein
VPDPYLVISNYHLTSQNHARLQAKLHQVFLWLTNILYNKKPLVLYIDILTKL